MGNTSMAESWQADYDLPPAPPPESPSPHVAPQSRPPPSGIMDKRTQWLIQRYDEEYSSADNFDKARYTTNNKMSMQAWGRNRQRWNNLSDEEKYKEAKCYFVFYLLLFFGIILIIVI